MSWKLLHVWAYVKRFTSGVPNSEVQQVVSPYGPTAR